MDNRITIEPELVRLFSRGDAHAFRLVVDQLMKPAYFHALAVLGNHDDYKRYKDIIR